MAAWPLPALRSRRARSRPDFLLAFGAVALSALGLLMIYTVTAPRIEAAGVDPGGDMVRQAFFMAAGVVVFIVASLISDRQWKMLAPYAYVGAVLLLLVVLTPIGALRFGGAAVDPPGPDRPAAVGVRQAGHDPRPGGAALVGGGGRVGWARIGQTLGLMAVPSALIFVQPDLGTMLVFGFVALVMLFVAGTTVRQLVLLLVVALSPW